MVPVPVLGGSSLRLCIECLLLVVALLLCCGCGFHREAGTAFRVCMGERREERWGMNAHGGELDAGMVCTVPAS